MFKRRKSIAAPSFMVQDESVVIQAATSDPSELLEVLDKNSNPLFRVQYDGDVLIGQQVAATQSYVDTAISNLVDAAPAALNTLNELAAALNDDSNFSGTVTTALSGKAPLDSPALTGTPTAPTAALNTDTTQIATTAFVQDAITAYSGTLDGLSDVVITAPEEFQGLSYNGVSWVNSHIPLVSYVRNAEATTITTGTCVYLFGATGDHATVKRADNNSDATSSKTIGVAAANIAASENGPIVTRGYVDGIDLSVGYTPGDVLWLGENGAFTTTKPTAPDHLVFIGVVVRATNNGIIYVATQNGYELDELHNVSLPSPSSGQFLKYDGSLWVASYPDLGRASHAIASGSLYPAISSGTGWQSWPSSPASLSFAKQYASTNLFITVQGSFYKSVYGNVKIGVNVGGTYHQIAFCNVPDASNFALSGSIVITGVPAGSISCTTACQVSSGTIQIFGSEHSNSIAVMEVSP